MFALDVAARHPVQFQMQGNEAVAMLRVARDECYPNVFKTERRKINRSASDKSKKGLNMARFPFFYSQVLWSATASISVMKMLAVQAEENVTRAVSEEVITRISSFGSYDEDRYDNSGNCIGAWQRDYFTCGSCYGHDENEVEAEYKYLITQLTRRSAYLTIFGIFEHRIIDCLKIMAELTGKEVRKRPSVEDCHNLLTSEIGAKGIVDLNHLIAIRNVMAHSDGVAVNYDSLFERKDSLRGADRKFIDGVTRAVSGDCGISITMFNNLNMDGQFLDYAIGEFEQYAYKLEAAVHAYLDKLELQRLM